MANCEYCGEPLPPTVRSDARFHKTCKHKARRRRADPLIGSAGRKSAQREGLEIRRERLVLDLQKSELLDATGPHRTYDYSPAPRSAEREEEESDPAYWRRMKEARPGSETRPWITAETKQQLRRIDPSEPVTLRILSLELPTPERYRDLEDDPWNRSVYREFYAYVQIAQLAWGMLRIAAASGATGQLSDDDVRELRRLSDRLDWTRPGIEPLKFEETVRYREIDRLMRGRPDAPIAEAELWRFTIREPTPTEARYVAVEIDDVPTLEEFTDMLEAEAFRQMLIEDRARLVAEIKLENAIHRAEMDERLSRAGFLSEAEVSEAVDRFIEEAR